MSEFYGYKCDMCGDVIRTGVRIAGDKKQEIQGVRRKYPYRFDICERCFNELKERCVKLKSQCGESALTASADGRTPNKER